MKNRTKKTKPFHKHCNCCMCKVIEIGDNLIEIKGLEETYGIDKARFIYLLLEVCLGVIKNDTLDTMLDKANDMQECFHNFMMCLGEQEGLDVVISKTEHELTNRR